MTTHVAPETVAIPALASGYVDPADLWGADHHGRRRPAPVQRAAVAVTIDNQPVVHLWAGHADAARTHR